MKLFYRGSAYNYNPLAVTMVDGEVGGQFRGLDWRFRNLKEQPVQLPNLNLTYRGINYQTNPGANPGAAKAAPEAVTLSVKDLAHSTMKLLYRGLAYDYNTPTVAMADGDVGGKFRGSDWRFHNLKAQFVKLPILNLIYRGVHH